MFLLELRNREEDIRKDIIEIIKKAEKNCNHTDKDLIVFVVRAIPYGIIVCKECFIKIVPKLRNRKAILPRFVEGYY